MRKLPDIKPAAEKNERTMGQRDRNHPVSEVVTRRKYTSSSDREICRKTFFFRENGVLFQKPVPLKKPSGQESISVSGFHPEQPDLQALPESL